MVNSRINSVKQWSLVTSPDDNSLSSVFLFKKSIVYLKFKREEVSQVRYNLPKEKIITCKLFQFPEERILYSTKKELFIQSKTSSQDFTLIGQLSKKSSNSFSNIFYSNESKKLYIIIDSIILIEFNPFLHKSNPSDFQKIIDANNNQSNLNNSLIGDDYKKVANIMDDFNVVVKTEESSGYTFSVARNVFDKFKVSIQTIVLFSKQIQRLIFKPHCKESDSPTEFLITHPNEILIFDEIELTCVKRIKYKMNQIKKIDYSSDAKFLLISLDDDYVYGIDLYENKCVFCLEGHKSFVSNMIMTKRALPCGFPNKTSDIKIAGANYSNPNFSSMKFKEVGFDDYLETYFRVIVDNKKEFKEDVESLSRATALVNDSNDIVDEKLKEKEGSKTEDIYEIITVGYDGFIGLWKYAHTASVANNNVKDLNQNLIEDSKKEVPLLKVSICNFSLAKEILLLPALYSKDYLHISPLELTNLVSKPMIGLHLIDNKTLFTIAQRSRNNNELFILLLTHKIDTSLYQAQRDHDFPLSLNE